MAADKVLVDFERDFDIGSQVWTDGAQVKFSPGNSGRALEVLLSRAKTTPQIFLSSTGWDLSAYLGLSLDVTNPGTKTVRVLAEVSVGNTYPSNSSQVVVGPGKTESLFITFYRKQTAIPEYMKPYFTSMNGLPGGFLTHWECPDLAKINRIRIFASKSDQDTRILVDNIRAREGYRLPELSELKSGFFPFVDPFGQFAHGDWPGKTRSAEQMRDQHRLELKELEADPQPKAWNQFGGWSAGPGREATGHFRTEKINGKWWLVDPSGRLFWSQGVDVVGLSLKAITSGKEYYFQSIPKGGDFRLANLMAKYAADSSGTVRSASEMIHKRLKSWGLNTIANWSDSGIYSMKKTPYVVTLVSGLAKQVPTQLEAAGFRNSLEKIINPASVAHFANDPWCLGAFIDNELDWPASNSAATAETYYRVVREVFKKAAPHKLYLGSRVHGLNPDVLRAASRYCDVVSVNYYTFTVFQLRLPDGSADKPMLIGEFQFGALDRGMLHTGFRGLGNQEQRAYAYSEYLRESLEHERLVGVHWFQFTDQPVAGRADGENNQIGFVDVADRPYAELVAKSRYWGKGLYSYRFTGQYDSLGGPTAARTPSQARKTFPAGSQNPMPYYLNGRLRQKPSCPLGETPCHDR